MKRVVVTISLIALIAPATALARAPQSPLEPASRSGCGPADSGHAPERAQETALRCLINRVRDRAGVQNLASHKALERAAGGKVGDVADCGLSHTACGNAADSWARKTGYINGKGSWMWGENLAQGKRGRGTARSVLKAWLHSPPHRQTLLTGAFEHLGIGFKRKGNTGVWVLQVGCHGCG